MQRKSTKTGIKTYHRFSTAGFVYGAFSFSTAAMVLVHLFTPLVGFQKSGQALISISGLDFFLYGFNMFVPRLASAKFNTFTPYFTGMESQNEILVFICQKHGLVELGLAAFMVLTLLFTFLLMISSFKWLFFGKASPSATKWFNIAISFFYFLYLLFVYLYLFFFGEIIKNNGQDASAQISLISIAVLAAIIFLTFIICIFYRFAFKNRIFVDDKKEEIQAEEENKETSEPTKETNNQQPPANNG